MYRGLVAKSVLCHVNHISLWRW